MSYSKKIFIDKLMFWRGNSWIYYEGKPCQCTLRIIGDQLVISTDMKIVESLNMRSKIKGIYKSDVLILIISNNASDIRKLKFQIKENVTECIELLSHHFTMVNHVSQFKHVVSSRHKNLDEVFRNAVEMMEKDGNGSHESLELSSPSYKNFVRLCLLDPTFPQVVRETQMTIDKDILKK